MDSVPAPDTTVTAANYAAPYSTLGRRQAEFWASQANAARANGTEDVSLGFKDVLDLVNPLKHLPIVRNIYEAIAGEDEMKPAVKLVGDSIYGGPLGMISSGVDAIIKSASGKDILETMAGWFDGDAQTQTAAAEPEDIKLANVQWNPAPRPLYAAAVPAQANNMPANDAPVLAAISPSAPSSTVSGAPSPLFQSLRRNSANGSTMPSPPPTHAYFNPTAKQFNGLQNVSATVPMPVDASKDSKSMSETVAKPLENIATNPQSDFAEKMMQALDRYQASKAAGTATAPAISTGL